MNKAQIHLGNPLALILAGSAIALAILIPNPVLTTLAVALVGLVSVAGLWAWHTRDRLSFSRTLRLEWAQVGDELEERFVLRNDSSLSLFWIELEDGSTVPGYPSSRVEAVDGHNIKRWTLAAECQQRGLYRLGPMTLHSSDPFGIWGLTWHDAATRDVLVYPPIVDLSGIDLPRGQTMGPSRTSQRAYQATTDAAGVREYAPGDSLSRIHWPSTARRNEFMVKEFDLYPSGDVWVVLDLDGRVQAGTGRESTVEYGVMLASSLAYRAVQENRAVGLAVYGPARTIVQPDRGLAQLWRILSVLTTAAPGEMPLEHVLAEVGAHVTRGMTAVVVTPALEVDWVVRLLGLARRGVTPSVLILDPVTFGGHGDAGALAGVLADMGIPGHIIRQGQAFDLIAR
ncbi:MAG: DUF58 domain-containing protein, partial [Chloroflexi bacterium]|nr:DUF58 domain-containing protein [Chloroflexota bacterium]